MRILVNIGTELHREHSFNDYNLLELLLVPYDESDSDVEKLETVHCREAVGREG